CARSLLRSYYFDYW
nr:immunoglobulin heavy chain junction region [Mus musculus]MBK4195990.1 immunoglobulin heavy chain junction region [Mus musculus]